MNELLDTLEGLLIASAFLAAVVGGPALLLALSFKSERPSHEPRSMRVLLQNIYRRERRFMWQGRMTMQALKELIDYDRKHPRWRWFSSPQTIAAYKEIMQMYGPSYDAYLTGE